MQITRVFLRCFLHNKSDKTLFGDLISSVKVGDWGEGEVEVEVEVGAYSSSNPAINPSAALGATQILNCPGSTTYSPSGL